jgi:flavin reductase (DIM6/NTAB) family NADH-FMN oxidoreductase RutF
MGQKRLQKNARFDTQYFPLNIALLTVGENMMPIGNWTVISKDPFRILIAMSVGNHSLTLLKRYKEAALHFLPWSDRERVVRAGHISGRKVEKASELGFNLLPAERLSHTKLIKDVESIYEMIVHRELLNLSREYILYVMHVVNVHGSVSPEEREPILYLSLEDFATIGERWRYHS